MPAPTDAYLEARVLPADIPDDAIRITMWAEAMDPAGIETTHLPLWLDHVRRRLPDDLMQQIFGNRSPGASAIARIWASTAIPSAVISALRPSSRKLGTRPTMSDLLAGLRLADRILVVQEATRLMSALPDCPEKAEAEVIRAAMLSERGVVGARKLQKGSHPLAAMLLGRPSSSLPRVEERDWLREWARVGCLRDMIRAIRDLVWLMRQDD